jgi:DNA-binding protein Fis
MRVASTPLLTLTAADLMTRAVVRLPEEMPLRDAARLLLQNQIGGAPVVDAQGRCVGVLSAIDFLRLAEKRGDVTKPASPPLPVTCCFQEKHRRPDGTAACSQGWPVPGDDSMNREVKQLELEELRTRVRRLEAERAEAPGPEPLNLRELEQRAVRAAMQQAKGNKVHAARALGISRRALYRLIKKYHLEENTTGAELAPHQTAV